MQTTVLTHNIVVTIGTLALLAIIGAILDRLTDWAVRRISQLTLDDTGEFMGPERTEQVSARIRQVLRMVLGLLALVTIGAAGYFTWQGTDLWEVLRQKTIRLSQGYFQALAVALAQFIAVLILLRLVGWLGRLIADWIVQRLQAAQIVRVDDERVNQIGDRLLSTIRALLWYAAGMIGADLFGFSETGTLVVVTALELVVVYCLVRLLALVLSASVDGIYQGLVHHWDEKDDPLYESRSRIEELASRIKMALRWVVYIAAVLYVASRVIFGTLGVGEPNLDQIFYDLAIKAAKVVGIFIGAMLIVEIGALVIQRLSRRTEDDELAAKREQTIIPLLSSVLRYVVYFIAAVMALNVFNMDTTAILAGAGVAGVAIGFGAQHLIKDVVTGFFILFEGYYWVGDWIETDNGGGIVEGITIRTTWIRDRDGTVHIIPNGQITALTSYSREFCKSVVEVGVAYEGDLERAVEITEDVIGDFADHEPDVTGEPEIHVMAFNASDIGLRIRVPVLPKRHVAVGSKIRRLIKRAYDEAGVEIPFSRHVVQFEQADGTQVDELPVRLVHDSPEQ
ncbi:MAG: mechanosensitive ion channel family protein [Armatimonadota bacterium]